MTQAIAQISCNWICRKSLSHFICAMVKAMQLTIVTCREIEDAGHQVHEMFTEELVGAVELLIQQGVASGEYQGVWEEICTTAETEHVAWYANVAAEHCGIHPANRSAFGVGGTDSQNLGGNILKVGFSWKKSAESTAFQTPPPPLDQPIMIYNTNLVEVSDNLIPPLQQLTHVSIGGGHTNTFIRQCKARVRCVISGPDPERLCDENGHLDPDKIVIGRPAFKEALKTGMRFLVFHWQAAYIWPGLPDFAQQALNTTVQGQQSEVEVMLRLHKLASACVKAGTEINWSSIERMATQSMPFCAGWISALSTYVSKNAGGESGELMVELATYAKSKITGSADSGVTRVMGSEFILKLANLNFGPGQEFPRVKHACMQLQLSSPPNRIVDGICKLLVPSTLNELTKKERRADVKQADNLMSEARTLCTSVGVSAAQKVRICGRLDVRLAALLTKRIKEMFGDTAKFKSTNDIAEVCWRVCARLPEHASARMCVCVCVSLWVSLMCVHVVVCVFARRVRLFSCVFVCGGCCSNR